MGVMHVPLAGLAAVPRSTLSCSDQFGKHSGSKNVAHRSPPAPRPVSSALWATWTSNMIQGIQL